MTTTPRTKPPPEATAALLTPRGRGAVASIRYEGDVSRLESTTPPLFRAANGRPLSQQPLNRVIFGYWGTADNVGRIGNPSYPAVGRIGNPSYPPEEVVLCRVEENAVEIHCHGGEIAVERILADLEALGCRRLAWQELSRRQNGLFEAECLEALTKATTLRTANILLEQQTGLLRREIEEILRDAQSTDAEARLFGKSRASSPIISRLEALLRWSRFGLHLSDPWKVVLAGRPNVGKSSLLNALLGYSRAIVFDRPGTTRDVVTTQTAFDGWPVQLADTAGLRSDADPLESAGIDRARRILAEADCRVLLIDTGEPPQEDDLRLLRGWREAIAVAHKSDLPSRWPAEDLPAGAIPVSSLTGSGLPELMQAIVKKLVPQLPPPGTPLPVTGRQVDLLTQARRAAEQGGLHECQAALEELL